MIVNPLAKIKEKKIPLIKLGVSSRTFFHWKKENILFENTEPDETKQKVFLNLMDATWLMIIVEFRKYNIDLKTIKTIKDQLIVELDTQKIIDNKAILENVLVSIAKDFNAKQTEELLQIDVEYIVNHVMSPYDKFLVFTKLGSALGRVLLGSLEYIMVTVDDNGVVETNVFSRGEYFEVEDNNYFLSEFNRLINHKSCFTISLVTILESLLENEQLEKFHFEFGLYNNEEMKIFDALKQDNWKKITIVKHNSGDLTITNESEVEKRGQHAKEIKKILGLKQYEQLEITYRNDQHLIIKNTKKEIIKKS